MDNSNIEGTDTVASFEDDNLNSSREQEHAKRVVNSDSFRFSIKFNLNKEHHRTSSFGSTSKKWLNKQAISKFPDVSNSQDL